MTDPSTVYILDDDEGVRDSLSALLKARGLTVTTFSSGSEFLDRTDSAPMGCLLLDVRMPGLSGLEVQQRLNEMGWQTPVILMTGHGDLPMAVQAMKAGAFDFIEKPFDKEALLQRVQQAFERSAELGRDTAAVQAIEVNLKRLTPREKDVLEKLVEGHPNKVIAYELGISARTVEVHRGRVMEKMQARTLSHLVRMAIATGIVSA